MQRRDFLKSSGAVAGLAAASFANALALPTGAARLLLLRAEEARAGAAFLPLSHAPCAACAVPVLQVSIGGLHPAEGGPVLDDLAVSAMFDQPDGGSVPFVAWRYSAGPVPSRTDRVRFIADRSTMRRLEFDFRIAGGDCQRHEGCHLTSPDTPLLLPGQYVLVGPRRDGARARTEGLLYTGDADAPIAAKDARDFDYLPIRMEAVA